MLPIAVKTKFSHTGSSGARLRATSMSARVKGGVNLSYPYDIRAEQRGAWAARKLAEKLGYGDRRIVTADTQGEEQVHIVMDEIDPAHQWVIEVLVYYPANSAAQFKARALRNGHDVLHIEGGGSGDYGAHAMCQRLADAGLIPKYEGYYNSLVIREILEALCTTTEVQRKKDFEF